MSTAPSDRNVAVVRGWLLLVLACLLIVHGALAGGDFAEIAYGFTLLGIEPLARARTEIVP